MTRRFCCATEIEFCDGIARRADDYFGDVAERDQLDAAGNGCASGDHAPAVSSSVLPDQILMEEDFPEARKRRWKPGGLQ